MLIARNFGSSALNMLNLQLIETLVGVMTQSSLVCCALQHAIGERCPAPGLIHHSDREVQYACREYVEQFHDIGAQISLSAVGNPSDNAKAESFFQTLKQEKVSRKKYRSFEEAE